MSSLPVSNPRSQWVQKTSHNWWQFGGKNNPHLVTTVQSTLQICQLLQFGGHFAFRSSSYISTLQFGQQHPVSVFRLQIISGRFNFADILKPTELLVVTISYAFDSKLHVCRNLTVSRNLQEWELNFTPAFKTEYCFLINKAVFIVPPTEVTQYTSPVLTVQHLVCNTFNSTKLYTISFPLHK